MAIEDCTSCIHWEACDEYITDCVGYLAKAETEMWHSAYDNLMELRSRCVPDAEKLFDSHQWGLLMVVPKSKL